MTDFGKQLKNLRVRVGLTQTDLADASNLAQSTISALETGRQGPWPSTRRALARAFKMTLEGFDEAIRGNGEPEIRAADPPQRWRESLGKAPTAPDLSYASTKVMELLNELGRTERLLQQYEMAVQSVCAACWTTDATLHITGAFGPVAAEQRNLHGEFTGRHVGEFFEVAWSESDPEFLPLRMQQEAADGKPVGFAWSLARRRYMVYLDPVLDASGHVTGTVGMAIDITDRVVAADDGPEAD